MSIQFFYLFICLVNSPKATADGDDDDDDNSNNNSIKFFTYLDDKLNRQGPITGWLVGWLVYSCCSHLEHIQFLNLRQSVGLIGRVTSRSQGRYLTQAQKHTETSIP
jgi:hypothetical protein